jgi:phthiodiolone/phenolphthiodiolone dimycocerosates ketoreductase
MRLTFGHVGASVDSLSAFEYGVLAEKAGFDTLWLPDHFVDINGDRLEPWTVLSAVAARTKRIRLGSGVTDAQRNHPARTAHSVASLDVISRGRAILGIGAGEAMNIEPFGLPWESVHERVARLSESIRVIRLLWSSSRDKPVSFDGRYYHLKEAYLTQPPRQRPHPPIYVGVFASKTALQVVGQLADGWMPWINTPDTFKRRWSVIKEAAQLAGRNIKQIEPATHLMVAFPRNSKERRLALLAGKAFLVTEKTVLASLGYKADAQLHHYQNLVASKEYIREVMDATQALPDEVVYRTMAIGGADEVREKIEELARVGVKHFALASLVAPRGLWRNLQVLSKVIRHYHRTNPSLEQP